MSALHTPTTTWQQINIVFPGGSHTAEQFAATRLCPRLTAAQADGTVTDWWFLRKGPWRVRYAPGPEGEEHAAEHVAAIASELQHDRSVTAWAHAVYEPEIRAFGGPDGLACAHRLFAEDSHHFLQHLAADGPDRRRELSLLLCTALMRAAGLDRFERGDVWDKVAATRQPVPRPEADRWNDFQRAVTRLISVDTSHGTDVRRDLGDAAAWLHAFETAGSRLARLHADHHLQRGLRAVLAHYVIFHWNRIGLPAAQQRHLADAAAEACFA